VFVIGLLQSQVHLLKRRRTAATVVLTLRILIVLSKDVALAIWVRSFLLEKFLPLKNQTKTRAAVL